LVQVRRNRLLSLKVENDTDYVDRRAIAAEITETKKLCARNNWPVIDVTRRSIEETAAGILSLYNERKAANET
jgi:regulator of PEP synthase PpsR (kinase-PPPase family)